MKRDNITWDKAKAKAKQEFESDRKKAVREEKQQMAEFKKQVGKIKFVRATTKTDIKKDKVLPALPSGKRYPKRGTTTNKWGTFKNNTKRPYWENRANRMDVNQPSKSVYPKLAKGGYVGEKTLEGGYRTIEQAEKMKKVFENAVSTKNSEYQLSFVIEKDNNTKSDIKYLLFKIKGNKKLAKGGMTEHGLQVGDKIVMDVQKRVSNMPNTIGVEDYDKEFHLVDLDKGERYEKGGKVGQKFFEAKEDGILGIFSGSDAYSIQISKGDTFVTYGDQDNSNWWYVKKIDKKPSAMSLNNNFDYTKSKSRVKVNWDDLILTFPKGDNMIYAKMQEIHAQGGTTKRIKRMGC
jgi:hypothetical protein